MQFEATVIRAGGTGGGRNEFNYAAAYRPVDGATIRGATFTHDTDSYVLFRQRISAVFLTDALPAGAYEIGYCFEDRETDIDYEVQPAPGVLMVIPADTP